MTTLRCQVTLANVNGLPADAATNTWHFSSNSVDPLVDAATIILNLEGFYETIGAELSAGLAGTLAMKVYDLEEPQPRVPILEGTGAFTPGAGQSLPSECAIVLSYRAPTFSGGSPGRRRGRIFIGPLDAGVLADDDGNTFVSSTAAGDIRTAAQGLLAESDPAAASWAVFSPTTAGPEPWTTGELLAATLDVVGGHVDNAFDTMRSRGVEPTTRVFFPI